MVCVPLYTIYLWSLLESICVCVYLHYTRGFPGGTKVKNSPDSAVDSGSTHGLGSSSLEEEMATHSSIFVWEIPWTEEPGWLQSVGLQSQVT